VHGDTLAHEGVLPHVVVLACDGLIGILGVFALCRCSPI
jgi:hypothetical protein